MSNKDYYYYLNNWASLIGERYEKSEKKFKREYENEWIGSEDTIFALRIEIKIIREKNNKLMEENNKLMEENKDLLEIIKTLRPHLERFQQLDLGH